jgi:FkbM family methyltransferase
MAEQDKQARLATAVGLLAEDRSRDSLLGVLAQPPVELWRRWLKQVLNGLEYFDVVTLGEGDVVLNAGVHGGGEVPNFFARVGPTGRVVNVDPLGDAYLSNFVKAAIAAFPGRCNWIAAALHDRDGTLDLPVEPGGMAAGNRVGEQVAGMTTRSFAARSIDSIAAELDLPRLDLIKMDVEGAEPPALDGAMRTIERFRPQLAISIYHEPDHFLDIPGFLGRTLRDYRFYVRNYHFIANETILYAVPVGRRVQEPPQAVEIALV